MEHLFALPGCERGKTSGMETWLAVIDPTIARKRDEDVLV
jgi:hypothetical protein